jgi:hypothetical protein
MTRFMRPENVVETKNVQLVENYPSCSQAMATRDRMRQNEKLASNNMTLCMTCFIIKLILYVSFI